MGLSDVGSFQSEGRGIKGAHAEAGNLPKSRGLLAWEMVKDLEGCEVDW